APGTRTVAPARHPLSPTAPPPADEKTPRRSASTVAPPPRRRQPRLPLIAAACAAALLIVAGLWILRSVLPVDRLLVQMIATPASVVPTEVALVDQTPIPEETDAEAQTTPTVLPAVEEAQTPQATPSPVITTTQTPVPAPTIKVDVELYWDVVVDDYNQRK